MLKIFLLKSEGVLLPATAQSERVVSEDMKERRIYRCELKLSRNPDHHDLIFALARIAVVHSPHTSPWHAETKSEVSVKAYQFIKACLMDAGIVDQFMKLDGTVYYEPKSIAFDSMDEEEFEPVSDKVFKETSRIINVDEGYLRENYKDILMQF